MESTGHHRCTFAPFVIGTEQITAEKDLEHTLVFVIAAVTGLIMNSLVLILVACNRKLRTKPFLFLISISAADAVFTLYGALKTVIKSIHMVNEEDHNSKLDFVKAACWTVSHLEIAIQSTLVLSLVAVSLERYIVICKPLKAKHIWTRKRCRYFIVIIWIISFSLGFIKPINTTVTCHRFCDEHQQMYQINLCEYKSRMTVAVIRFVTLFAIPFLFMLVTYGQVIYTLWISSNTQMDLTQASCRRAIMKQMHDRRMRPSATSSTITISSSIGSSFTGSLQSMFGKSVDTDGPSLDKKLSVLSGNQIIPVPTSAKKQQVVKEICNGRKRLIKMLVLVIVIFFVCYGPNVSTDISVALETLNHQQVVFNETTQNLTAAYINDVPTITLPSCKDIQSDSKDYNGTNETRISYNTLDMVQQFSRMAMLLHSTLNPLLYFIFSKDFQSALVRSVRYCKTRIISLFL